MSEPFEQPVNPYARRQLTPEEQARVQFLNEANKRLKEQVISVFCNPHGLQLLETLESVFLHQPVCPPGCVKGYGYMREGENGLIRRIRKIVNIGMSPATEQSEGSVQ